jgi:hypothetical protein
MLGQYEKSGMNDKKVSWIHEMVEGESEERNRKFQHKS